MPPRRPAPTPAPPERAALDQAIGELRAALAAPPEDDTIRERYGELVDRHRDDPEAMEQLRALGDEIRALEDAGVLPSALVIRAPRGPRDRT
jgi:hypothetical protein